MTDDPMNYDLTTMSQRMYDIFWYVYAHVIDVLNILRDVSFIGPARHMWPIPGLRNTHHSQLTPNKVAIVHIPRMRSEC